MNSKSKALCSVGVITTLALFSWPAQAQDKWEPYIDLEGKIGNERDVGEIDLFMPLSQDDDTLFFSDLRLRTDNNSSSEGNFGLGLRQMLDHGWNVGAYGYFDRTAAKHPMIIISIRLHWAQSCWAKIGMCV
ncbi:hypothetical protein A11S_2332 [Micavibrio aeruginosavorus EPB]|uniref:Inverse autotransporter beta-domain domain-containing protein n=2 Tax=Micavibrio aeruginosavorus TaxID=349221 RepID=M4VIB8_9BACT|nr:hypothetical protein A11S_2332 [Micavibrio aeruginosavorus EPB]